MKKILIGFALVISVVVVVACNHPAQNKGQLEVALLVSSLDNPFFKDMADSASYESEILDLKLRVMDSENDGSLEMDHIDYIIDQGMDGVLLNPTDSKESSASVKRLNEAGIPVLTIDRNVDSGNIVTFISSDNESGGRLAGEYIKQVLGNEGGLLIMEGIKGTDANTGRIKGVKEAISTSEIKVVGQVVGDFDKETAYTVMKGAFAEFTGIDAVFAANDEMALGIVDAMMDSGKDIIIVGFDGTQEGLNAVMNGYIAATIAQQPDVMVKTGLENLMKSIHGEEVKNRIAIPLKLISISK